MADLTPGPWELRNGVIVSEGSKFGAVIAATYGANKHANANLIKAAPDMYAALELILPLAIGYNPKGQTPKARQTCLSWINAAEAALAKVDGND